MTGDGGYPHGDWCGGCQHLHKNGEPCDSCIPSNWEPQRDEKEMLLDQISSLEDELRELRRRTDGQRL